MKRAGSSSWSLIVALIMIFSVNGRLAAEEGHQHQHDMQEMRIPERGNPSAVPAGAVRQDAGAEMMNRLTHRLDKEIENASGQMGGFTKASDAHTQSQGVPLLISNEESVTKGGRCLVFVLV